MLVIDKVLNECFGLPKFKTVLLAIIEREARDAMPSSEQVEQQRTGIHAPTERHDGPFHLSPPPSTCASAVISAKVGCFSRPIQ